MLCKPKYPFFPHTEIFDDHLFQLVAENGIIRKEGRPCLATEEAKSQKLLAKADGAKIWSYCVVA